MAYPSNVFSGERLYPYIENSRRFQERDFVESLSGFIDDQNDLRTGVICGLRRTGKTVAMMHAMARFSNGRLGKTAYVLGRKFDSITGMDQIFRQLADDGFTTIFLDEATKINGFVDNASLFADVYAQPGIKIVISGTDSLGLLIAGENELFGRARFFFSTHIPFREHARLKGTGMHEYIESGGILIGSPEDSSELFKKDYSLLAICHNIQNSLKQYNEGGSFMELAELKEKKCPDRSHKQSHPVSHTQVRREIPQRSFQVAGHRLSG